MARFSIEEFKAHVARLGGIAKPNRFFVSFTPPAIVANQRNPGNSIEYFCEAVNLPGFQLNTQEYRRYQYGPSEKRPFGPHVNPLQMTILADQGGTMWHFFHDWLYSILPNSSRGGIQRPLDNGSGEIYYPYQIEYRHRYVTDISIYHLPEHYNGGTNLSDFTARTICQDCFPTAIVDLPLNWSDNNNLARFGVQFDYTDFHYRQELQEQG